MNEGRPGGRSKAMSYKRYPFGAAWMPTWSAGQVISSMADGSTVESDANRDKRRTPGDLVRSETSGCHYALDTFRTFVPEGLVKAGTVLERATMGDDDAGIDLARLDPL